MFLTQGDSEYLYGFCKYGLLPRFEASEAQSTLSSGSYHCVVSEVSGTDGVQAPEMFIVSFDSDTNISTEVTNFTSSSSYKTWKLNGEGSINQMGEKSDKLTMTYSLDYGQIGSSNLDQTWLESVQLFPIFAQRAKDSASDVKPTFFADVKGQQKRMYYGQGDVDVFRRRLMDTTIWFSN